MSEQIIRWANYVKDNPTKWKKTHTKFINAQFDKHRKFNTRLLKTKNGKEKFIKLYSTIFSIDLGFPIFQFHHILCNSILVCLNSIDLVLLI